MTTAFKKPSKREQEILLDLIQELSYLITLSAEAITYGYKSYSPFEYADVTPSIGHDIECRLKNVQEISKNLSLSKQGKK